MDMDMKKKRKQQQQRPDYHNNKKNKNYLSDDYLNDVLKRLSKFPDIGRSPMIRKASEDCQVVKIVIKDGMVVHKGQTLFLCESLLYPSDFSQLPTTISEGLKSRIKLALSRRPCDDICHLLSSQDDDYNNVPMSVRRYSDICIPQSNLSFSVVNDFSDHLFRANSLTIPKDEQEDWRNIMFKEWRFLAQELPLMSMFVTVYESRMDLLRAGIIGPEGTPYQGGLFFFDLFFPSTYPYSPPLVRCLSGGNGIHQNVLDCSEICLGLFKRNGCKRDGIWVPGTSNIVQLLLHIRDLILNKKPFFRRLGFAKMRGSVDGEKFSFLYNENTVIKSLYYMVHTMNKPPKNCEKSVIWYYREHVISVLKACKSYVDGFQHGCFGSEDKGNMETSIEFKNDVASCLKPLIAAFKKIGAVQAENFLYLSEKITPLPSASAAATPGTSKSYQRRRYQVDAPMAFVVENVLVKEGDIVNSGKPFYSFKAMKMEDGAMTISNSATQESPDSKELLN